MKLLSTKTVPEEVPSKKGTKSGKKEFKNNLFERLVAWKKEESSNVTVGGIPENIFSQSPESIEFPCDLTPAERRIVHQLCLRLDLFHCSKGEGEHRKVTISKSIDFFETNIANSPGEVTEGDKIGSSIWYDERAIKPSVKARYFEMSDKDIKRLHEKVEGIPSVDSKVVVTLDVSYLRMNHVDSNGQGADQKAFEINCNGNLASYPGNPAASQQFNHRLQMFLQAMDPIITNDQHRLVLDSTDSAAITTTAGAASTNTQASYTSMHIDRSYSAEDVLIQATIIDTAELLRQAGARLRICHQISFDLEMHSFRSYHGVTCLIQISGGGVNYLVDPLAPGLWKLVPEVLGPIFNDPKIVKIGHGIMGGDIPALFRDFGIVLVNAFDTQEASACLGRAGLGLASLLDQWGCPSKREVASLKEQMKHTDWRLRPLTPVMIRYAVLDVHYLIPLYRLMMRELILASVNTSWKDALSILRKNKEEKELAKKQKLAMIKEMKKPNPPSSTKTPGVPGSTNSNNTLTKQVSLPLKSDNLLPLSTNGKKEEGMVVGSSMPVSSSPSSSSSMLVHAVTFGIISNTIFLQR